MDELATLHPDGIFLRREALAFGYRDRDLIASRRAGLLTRIRHGAFVSSAVWNAADPVERHRLHARAVLLTHPGSALSHTSGAVVHGLRLYRPDLRRVHLTRLDGWAGRHAPDVVYHRDGWRADDVQEIDGMMVLGAATCAVSAASFMSLESSLCCLDSALDLERASLEDLWSAYAQRVQWPGSRRLRTALTLARPGAQSVLESRGRYFFWVHHLPEPQLQWHVYDADGMLVGITDFAWPEHKMLGEMDGKVKYGALLRPGETPTDAVFREKRREDRLREVTRWAMIRYVEQDLRHAAETAMRTRRALGLGAA